MLKKKNMSLFLVLILVIGLLSGCGQSETVETKKQVAHSDEAQKYIDILSDAYIYTLPLMLMDATSMKVTNTEEVTYTKAPINQFVHVPVLADATAKNVVKPNVDTIYSQAFLDLSDEAVIVELPKTERFCNVQVMDAYTNTVEILDLRTCEEDEQIYIFTGPSFTGEIPEGMNEITCPTSLVWILGRTACYNSGDANNVRDIQKKMKMYTLEQYLHGTTEQQPRGTYKEEAEIIPNEYVTSLSIEEYFNRANQLMVLNPPAEADAPVIQSFAAIHVGPDLKFSSEMFGEEADAIYQQIRSTVVEECTKGSAQFRVKNGCWIYNGDPVGDFGTEYDYRALIAYTALGINPIEVAVYLRAEADSQGDSFDGSSDYVIHINADEFPKVKEQGFWSITAYNSKGQLIHNDLNRYCINDRSEEVVYNEDGSLDIYLSQNPPTDDKLANWLPICQGEFSLAMRIYSPEDVVVANDWVTPTITKISNAE